MFAVRVLSVCAGRRFVVATTGMVSGRSVVESVAESVDDEGLKVGNATVDGKTGPSRG